MQDFSLVLHRLFVFDFSCGSNGFQLYRNKFSYKIECFIDTDNSFRLRNYGKKIKMMNFSANIFGVEFYSC